MDKPDRITKTLRIVVGLVLAALLLGAVWLAVAYAFSPASIRRPQGTHYHLRLQIINNGTPVNFADDKFQTPQGTVCSTVLTSEPVHFHDKLDQFVHIHWNHLTGGLVLKNYGWNFITGPDDTLGYRFDQLPRLARIPVHGHDLPKPPTDAKYYIYTGTGDAYQERKWNDFLKQDLRDFFAGKPLTSAWPQLIPTASAHSDDEKLTQLNDVVGSAVIFAQKDRPTGAQIQDRFNHLVPLPESTCGG